VRRKAPSIFLVGPVHQLSIYLSSVWKTKNTAKYDLHPDFYQETIITIFTFPEILLYSAISSRESSFIAFYPQVHLKQSLTFQIQVGFGFFFSFNGNFVAQLVHRAIYSSPNATE
jgi:hypothetical protein